MTEPGSLNTLLKYRFVKRSSSKIPHSGGEASHTNGEPVASSSGVNTKDEESSSPCSRSSPVLNTSFHTTSPDSTSPWLSKSDHYFCCTTTMTQNHSINRSHANSKQTTPHHCLDSESDIELVDPDSNNKPKISQWEQDLRSMFPASSPLVLKTALASAKQADCLEAGVDCLLQQGHDTIKSSGDSDGDIKKPRKRIRLMSSTDESSQDDGCDPKQTSDCSSSSLPDLHSQTTDQILAQAQQHSIQFLQEAFPMLSCQRLQQVLEDCEWKTEQAVVILSSDLNATGTHSQQSTVHATRSSTKGQVEMTVLEISDEEEEFDIDEDAEDSEDEDRSQDKKVVMLSFFEEATLAELLVLPGCSRKKAEAILEHRPFNTWENLVDKFTKTKLLSYSLIGGCSEIIHLRNVVVRLMKQCEHISAQMELLVSRLLDQLDGAQAEEEDYITSQPQLLNAHYQLKPYQLIGLNWLRLMHSQQLNGILADEMGLGKTVQAIAFLAHLLEEGEEGPHVIIVPSSTIENWLRELSTWCPALHVIVYYGSQEERRSTRSSIMYNKQKFNVLLTTYNMATGSVEDRSLFKKFQFQYAIFDEGHMLKNMSSLRFQNLMKILAERRLLLTGTPVQNNLLELMSLLCFVMPDIFQGKTESLKKMFSIISKENDKQGKYEKERIAQAQRIMRPFVLRRLKKDVLTQLPEKEERTDYIPLLPAQKELYQHLLSKFSLQISQQENTAHSTTAGMAMFMQLRKAANHPLLIRHHYTDDKLREMAIILAKEPSHRDRGALPDLIQEDMSVLNDFDIMGLCRQYQKHLGKYQLPLTVIGESAKFKALDRLLEEMSQQNDRVLLFSQFTMMLDVLQLYLQHKKVKHLRLDGATPVPDRQRLIDEFNNDPNIFIFLLSTRAGGLGINLTAANVIIIHDIDFNPYNDKQAEDRCHRLGQTRKVKIIRWIAKDTVEEGILQCAQAKLRLEQDITSSDGEPVADVAFLLQEAVGRVRTSFSEEQRLSLAGASTSS